MELKLNAGRYIFDGDGKLEELKAGEEKIQRIMCRLAARRGGFYPMPDFGSRLHTLFSMKPSSRPAAARQFVHEALEKETGVEIVEVECNERGDSLLLRLQLSVDGVGTELKFMV
ncbi:MAG: hypothetical protein IJV74_00145 [Clostridia bacterium]|nr:hypothetical protein [Oscillospiraceae bacterium]MBQ9732625.1 hypothetical protein [Clostridia bacterium]